MGAAVKGPFGIDPVQLWNLLLSAGAAAAGSGLVSPLFGGSLALGAALETANFRQLRRHCERIVFGAGAGSGLAAAGFGLRFALLAAAVGVALHAGAHPVGLLIGLSMIVPAALGVALRERPAPSREAPLPALAADDPSWDAWSVWRGRERELAADEAEEV